MTRPASIRPKPLALGTLLQAAGRELAAVTELLVELENTVLTHLERDEAAPGTMGELQRLDLIQQIVADLGRLLARIAPDVPSDLPVDPAVASAALTLERLHANLLQVSRIPTPDLPERRIDVF